MIKKTAGILVYRWRDHSEVQVFLGHPGGPYYSNKDHGCWTIPKGEFDKEDPLDAAIREFSEETGQTIAGDFSELPVFKVARTKILHAFVIEGAPDPACITSNTFELEWPPNSGILRFYPEIDRASWFTLREAVYRITKGQRPLLELLVTKLGLKASAFLE